MWKAVGGGKVLLQDGGEGEMTRRSERQRGGGGDAVTLGHSGVLEEDWARIEFLTCRREENQLREGLRQPGSDT